MAGPRTRTLVGAILLTLALSACGGDGGVSVPTRVPTGRPTLPTLPALPTVTLPTLPTLTLPTVTLPTLPGSTPDAPAAPTETTAPPAVDEEESETQAPEAEVPEAEAEEADDAEAEGGSGWVWLLLVLLAGAIVAATAVVLRRRRASAAWTEAVEEPVREAVWLRDTLVPNLLAQGPDGRAGIWAIGRPRVLTVQQRLEELVAQAPDVAASRRVEALSAAVEALRRALDQAGTLVEFGGTSIAAALQQSQYELDDAIRPLQPPPEDGGEQAPAG